MANFVLIEKDKYKVEGIITEEDIIRINSFKNRTTLILDNTVGLTSELISKITADRLVFSIKGGLDYEQKEKYNKQEFIERTYVSLSGLKKIVEYFEYNERLINPNWNEFEKAMFLYNALVVDMEYEEDYENIQSPGITERSLNGILYGKLVCAGFALVYKEMLDRVGIKCYYQNRRGHHDFNVIEIDGKKYGIDVTWDNDQKKKYGGRCSFEEFGHKSNFLLEKEHQLYFKRSQAKWDNTLEWADREDEEEIVYDPEEEHFDLSLIEMSKLDEYYSNIASAVNSRKPLRYKLQEESLEIKHQYLPINTVDLKLKQEAAQEYPITVIFDFLKKRNKVQLNEELLQALTFRERYILEMVPSDELSFSKVMLKKIGLDNYQIDSKGGISFKNNEEYRTDTLRGVFANSSNMPGKEIEEVCNFLNEYLNQYFKKYILDILKNLDTLLENYEYVPNEWDNDRAAESCNIYTKLILITNCPKYLMEQGFSKEEIENITKRIKEKHSQIYAPYETNFNQKENDLDFLYAVFSDTNMVWVTIEEDLGRKINQDEFNSFFRNVEYMIKLFENYIIIGGKDKFKFSDYSIAKEDLQSLLDRILNDKGLNVSQAESDTKSSTAR